MTARKLSISVPPEIEETIKTAAAEEGQPISAWLAEAAVEKVQIAVLHNQGRAAARELVAQDESEHGSLPALRQPADLGHDRGWAAGGGR